MYGWPCGRSSHANVPSSAELVSTPHPSMRAGRRSACAQHDARPGDRRAGLVVDDASADGAAAREPERHLVHVGQGDAAHLLQRTVRGARVEVEVPGASPPNRKCPASSATARLSPRTLGAGGGRARRPEHQAREFAAGQHHDAAARRHVGDRDPLVVVREPAAATPSRQSPGVTRRRPRRRRPTWTPTSRPSRPPRAS